MQRLSIAEQSPGQRFLGQQCFDHAMWLWRPCPRLELTCVEPSLSPDLGFIGAQGLPIIVSRNYENGVDISVQNFSIIALNAHCSVSEMFINSYLDRTPPKLCQIWC